MDYRNKRALFICDCENTEHQLIFSYDENDKDDESLYVTVHLKPEQNICKRIWRAVKYIFGYRSRYGEFDEFIFNPHDADRLQSVVDYLKSTKRFKNGWKNN